MLLAVNQRRYRVKPYCFVILGMRSYYLTSLLSLSLLSFVSSFSSILCACQKAFRRPIVTRNAFCPSCLVDLVRHPNRYLCGLLNALCKL
jgi:hypothetical protein